MLLKECDTHICCLRLVENITKLQYEKQINVSPMLKFDLKHLLLYYNWNEN